MFFFPHKKWKLLKKNVDEVQIQIGASQTLNWYPERFRLHPVQRKRNQTSGNTLVKIWNGSLGFELRTFFLTRQEWESKGHYSRWPGLSGARVLPRMEDHVEKESPNFLSLVRAVDEDGINWQWTRTRNFSMPDCVVSEETELQKIKELHINKEYDNDTLTQRANLMS